MSFPRATKPSVCLRLDWTIDTSVFPAKHFVGEWLATLTDRLSPQSDTPLLDGQVLLAHTLSQPRSWVMAHPEAALSASQAQEVGEYLLRLEAGEPLPYVLGVQEFYGLTFHVTPDVLIPRPETELLVEKALAGMRERCQPHVLDVGTGSGCIVVSLASHQPAAHFTACDISPAALHIAQENARWHGVDPLITFLQCDLFPPAACRYDIVCANLPYIPVEVLGRLRVSRWEPHLALDGGADGLYWIARLLQEAPGKIAAGGMLLLEIEASQGAAVSALAKNAFPQAKLGLFPDLAGKDRLVQITLAA